MKHSVKSFAAVILLTFATFGTMDAGPAKKGTFVVKQPDGTTFYAKIYGDEFSHKTTDLNGRTITQDSDGYWCYAEQTADGALMPSSQKVGGGYSAAAASQKAAYDKAAASGAVSYTFGNGATKSVSAKNVNGTDRRAEAAEMILRKRALTREMVSPVTKSVFEDGKTLNVMVLLVQFQDVKFTYKKSDFNSMLNSTGYSRYGGTGCAKEYFTEQFRNKVDFNFYVSPIITVSGNLKDYGGNDSNGDDKNPEGMVIEACRTLSTMDDTNFSRYDNFGKGEVDYLFVFFAGGDEAEYAGDDAIWSHASSIPTSKRETFNGVTIADYACTSELRATNWNKTSDGYVASQFSFTSIGTFCHEFSHMLGLMDMYDTDYDGSGGQSDGLWGSTSVMDNGNSNNDGNTPPNYSAVDRHYLGLSEPKTIYEGFHSLKPVNEEGDYYLIESSTANEYFLIEYRKQEGWDAYIGGSGLLAYHIDSTSNKTGYSDTYRKTLTAAERWYYNEVNCRPDHQCAMIIPASKSATKVNQVFFPYSNNKSLSASNGLKSWNGTAVNLSLNDITIEEDGYVSFVVPSSPSANTSASYELWGNTAIVSISINSESAPKSVSISYGVTGGKTEKLTLKPYETGKYAARLENLSPRKGYSVDVIVDGSTSKQLQFTTGASTGRNYIMLSDKGRNDDGTFSAGAKLPLVVNNSSSVEKIEWKFDDKPITPGNDGYYTVQTGGTLSAILYHSDGSIETIYKKVSVK